MRLRFLLSLLLILSVTSQTQADKVPVFIYAGQSNADGREYVENLPDYMKTGSLPYSPYTHLQWASICGNPTAASFGKRSMKNGERYAFCDVTNYWIDQAATSNFCAIKCAYGGTSIQPEATVAKLPKWYADATWLSTHNAYKGEDLTQAEYANNNSLTKNLTEGFASLVDGTLAAIDAGYDVKAIMWHQGESDRSYASAYYNNFKTLIAYMRQAIYDKTRDEADLQLPFIFGTICRKSTQYNATIEAAQRQVASEDANCYLIDMSNATLRSDNLHFDAQATEYLGIKMYNQLVDLGLVSGEKQTVTEFPVEASPMDEGTHYDSKTWTFCPLSTTTTTAMEAEVVATGALWNKNGNNYRRSSSFTTPAQLVYSTGTLVTETEGLWFTATNGNRIIFDTSLGLELVGGNATVYIPKLKAGQLIQFNARRGGNACTIVPAMGYEDYVELVSSSASLTTDYQTITYRMRYNVSGECHVGFTGGGGGNVYMKTLTISTPATVNVLIGAAQIETFASDQALDFSPFTDLFKAYVVTGYDDASGKVDMEQVLQVPANTGVVLMGEECEVSVPVAEGTPTLYVANLLTAVVGTATAPAGSFVLTTSGGETAFTKTAASTTISNQAYLASLGSLSSYGFNAMEAKTEHAYNIASLLDKNTTLTFTDDVHHTATYNSKTVNFYCPANAVPLDGRFAFDNGGKWMTDANNGSLGTTYKGNTLYASVVSLENGDRVKIEFTANATVTALNSVLRGVSAGSTLTSGTVYVVQTDGSGTVNLDLTLGTSANRQGFTAITVWTATETTPIYQALAPTATVALSEVRTGLYKPVATLTSETSGAAIYYKGGSTTDWTDLGGTTFEPMEKAEYQFKTVASGYADSEVLTLALGACYRRGVTIDLTTDEAYSSATSSNDGYTWDGWGLDDSQVYGKISSASFCGLEVTNGNNDARYSFAKNVGFANNYGGRVMNATAATTYNVVGYECYQNKSLSDIVERYVLCNGINANFTMPTVSGGGAVKAVYIYEPVEVATVTIGDVGYATYCHASALDFTGSGVEAYYATQEGDNVSFDNPIQNPAASTGLLLKAPAGTYEVIITDDGTDVSSTNKLVACFTEKTVGTTAGCEYGKVFILAEHNGTVGFYRSDNGSTLQPGKSYLYLENVSEARAAIGFPLGGDANAILSVGAPQQQLTHIYTLQGQRIDAPTTKGLYIVNGKKTIVK